MAKIRTPKNAEVNKQDESTLPTKPPFTAFVGNLAFDATDDDLRGLFGADSLVCMRSYGVGKHD